MPTLRGLWKSSYVLVGKSSCFTPLPRGGRICTMPGFFLGGGLFSKDFTLYQARIFSGGGGLVRKDLTMYHGRIPSLPSSRIAAKGPGRRPQPKSQGHISSGFYKQIQHRAPRSPSGILCSVLWHTSYVVDGKNLGEVGFPPVPLCPHSFPEVEVMTRKTCPTRLRTCHRALTKRLLVKTRQV